MIEPTATPWRHEGTHVIGADNQVIAVCRQAKPRNTMVALANGELIAAAVNAFAAPTGPKMTDERFDEIINGPLSHSLPMFTISRLAIALRAVIDATGKAGEEALERHAAERQFQDDHGDED